MNEVKKIVKAELKKQSVNLLLGILFQSTKENLLYS